MAEHSFEFPADFMDRTEVDAAFISELKKLTPDQREKLATLILERDVARHASN